MDYLILIAIFFGIVLFIWLSVHWRWKSWFIASGIYVLMNLVYFIFFSEPIPLDENGSQVISSSLVYWGFTSLLGAGCLLFAAISLFLSRGPN